MTRFLSHLQQIFTRFLRRFFDNRLILFVGVKVGMLLFLAGCAPGHFIDRQAGGVTLCLDVPDAGEVLFAASTDGFQLHPTKKNRGGVWTINNVADREFHYFYIVDGRVYVPDCQYRERDDFGASNCIYQP